MYITINVRQRLGEVIGHTEYITGQVESKVNEWKAKLQYPAEMAETQPHAAFPRFALTHRLMS